MEQPIQRYQIVFLNPDLTGLFTAFLLHRAGLKVAIVDELKSWQKDSGNINMAFPHYGSFRPAEIDLLASGSGFPPPIWTRVPQIELHLPHFSITLNSDSGPGGLTLALVEPFKVGKTTIASWIQNQINKTREQLSITKIKSGFSFRRIETSVADAILNLKLIDPDPFIILLDTLTILILGRGAVQLDVSDFHFVLAAFLNGWHVPEKGEKNWAQIILARFIKEKGKYIESERIVSIEHLEKYSSVIRDSDGSLISSQLIVFPECDRFNHPLTSGVSTIKWHNWFGKITESSSDSSKIGIIRIDSKRSPINDNFIAFRFGPELHDSIIVSAPVESRFLEESRLNVITDRIQQLINDHLKMEISALTPEPVNSTGSPINLPGTAPALSYPEGPLWGDDALSRLKTAERLSRRIIESVT